VGEGLVALTVADEPDAWERIGFAVADRATMVGGVCIELVGRGRGEGIVGWALGPAPGPERAPAHPNGALVVDHVVMRTPDFEATRAALVADGLELRRERGDLRSTRMAFFRLRPTILELVEAPGASEGLWGLVIVLPSVDDVAAPLAAHLGEPRDAVQPGRRIATLRASAGIGPALAFMTPR